MAKIVTYFKESYDELVNKVSWPSFSELRSSAVVVAVAALIFALVVFLMDWVMGINVSGFKGILGYIYAIFGK